MPHDPVQHLARYFVSGGVHFGVRDGAGWRRLDGAPWSGGRETGTVDTDVRLLPPCEPTKIVCVGLNYAAHAAESLTVVKGSAPADEPLLFLKPPSAVIGTGEPIHYPPGVTRLDPEAELAVVIGRRARAVPVQRAMEHVAGLTCINDVSARNYQKTDGQWARAKGFDTFAPLGPWIALGLDPHGLQVECRVNGARRQLGNTRDLRFDVPFLLSHVSHIMTLEPGDVIATGTPAGIAAVGPGDRIEVEVEGVGVLVNLVVGPAA